MANQTNKLRDKFTYRSDIKVHSLFHEECIRNNMSISDVIEAFTITYILDSRKAREEQKKLQEREQRNGVPG